MVSIISIHDHYLGLSSKRFTSDSSARYSQRHQHQNQKLQRTVSSFYFYSLSLVLLLISSLVLSGLHIPSFTNANGSNTLFPSAYLFELQLDHEALSVAKLRTGNAEMAQVYRFYLFRGVALSSFNGEFNNPAYTLNGLNLTTLLGVANEIHSDTPINTIKIMNTDLLRINRLFAAVKVILVGLGLSSIISIKLNPHKHQNLSTKSLILHGLLGISNIALPILFWVSLNYFIWNAVTFVTTYYWETSGQIFTHYLPTGFYIYASSISVICSLHGLYSILALLILAWKKLFASTHHKLL